MQILVATCQFPVSSDIASNLRWIGGQMREAKSRKADVAHFPEAALSGYAGVDLDSFGSYDWSALREATLAVIALARDLRLWVILGSAHPLTPPNKPHNSCYVIDAEGRIVDRYDKRFCAGPPDASASDLAHYTPGDHFCAIELKGVRCGVLICHEYRYPELYREYRKLDVELVFHSFHARASGPQEYAEMQAYVGYENRHFGIGSTLPAITMPAGMIASASNNYVWISCPNSSAPASCWGSFFVRPDGVITGALDVGTPGVLMSKVDTAEKLYDSTAAWRERAMNGRYNTGTLVEDARSKARTQL
jgi:predicted amidohydrolase